MSQIMSSRVKIFLIQLANVRVTQGHEYCNDYLQFPVHWQGSHKRQVTHFSSGLPECIWNLTKHW